MGGYFQAIYNEHEGRYGYRCIRDELANIGQKVNRKKIQRIMKELGLKCLVRIRLALDQPIHSFQRC